MSGVSYPKQNFFEIRSNIVWWLKQKIKERRKWREMPQGKENKMMHNNIAETKLCQKRSFEVPTYITKPSNKWCESQSH